MNYFCGAGNAGVTSNPVGETRKKREQVRVRMASDRVVFFEVRRNEAKSDVYGIANSYRRKLHFVK